MDVTVNAAPLPGASEAPPLGREMQPMAVAGDIGLAAGRPLTVTDPASALDNFAALAAGRSTTTTSAVTESLEAGLRGRRRYTRVVLLAADVTTLALALVGGQLACRALTGSGSLHDALASTIYIPIFVVVLNCYGMYERNRRRLVASSFPDLGRLTHALLAASLVMLFAAGGFHRWFGAPSVGRIGITLIAALALAGIPLGRAIARLLIRHPEKHASRVLVVGSGPVAHSVIRRLSRQEHLVVVGRVDELVDTADGPRHGITVLGGIERLPELVTKHDVDHIVVAMGSGESVDLSELLRSFAGQVQISVVPRLFGLLSVRSRVEDIAGITVVDVPTAALGLADRITKRALDIVVSGLGLALVSPLMIAIALAIKLESDGSILFRQARTGRGSRSFMIYKFRTMHTGAEAERAQLVAANDVDGPLFKIHEDPRITGIGRHLRKTSLDELPQLINVFKGDMSLVGPRPFVISEAAEIGGWAARRFDVRPGMTGLWQTSGRNDLPFDELCRLDYSYVSSWSLWWDLRILWHTPGILLKRHGAY
jgi:exopolysaccharide biosynthesis polyprenyl glycosylphosphotransferase